MRRTMGMEGSITLSNHQLIGLHICKTNILTWGDDPLILEFPVREVPHETTSKGRPQLKHQNPQFATSPNREAHCSIRNYTTNSQHLRRRSQLPQQPPENGEASLPNGVAQRHGILNTSQAVINSYPKFVFMKKSGPAADDGVCSICLLEYRESEMLRMLPDCRHCFHVMCVDAWLKLNASCSVCRSSPLPTPLQEVVPLSLYSDWRRRQ